MLILEPNVRVAIRDLIAKLHYVSKDPGFPLEEIVVRCLESINYKYNGDQKALMSAVESICIYEVKKEAADFDATWYRYAHLFRGSALGHVFESSQDKKRSARRGFKIVANSRMISDLLAELGAR